MARLRDDQPCTSPDIQSASALLNWICRLGTDKYERVCWYWESCQVLVCFFFSFFFKVGLSAHPCIHRAVWSFVVPFSHPLRVDCLRSVHFHAVAYGKKKSLWIEFDWDSVHPPPPPPPPGLWWCVNSPASLLQVRYAPVGASKSCIGERNKGHDWVTSCGSSHVQNSVAHGRKKKQKTPPLLLLRLRLSGDLHDVALCFWLLYFLKWGKRTSWMRCLVAQKVYQRSRVCRCLSLLKKKKITYHLQDPPLFPPHHDHRRHPANSQPNAAAVFSPAGLSTRHCLRFSKVASLDTEAQLGL